MSIDSLPYMVFLLLVELTVGGLLVIYLSQLRGLVTRGFLKMGAATTLISAALAVWSVTSLGRHTDVGGYQLDAGLLNPARVILWSLLALQALYTLLIWRERKPLETLLGGACSILGLGAIAITAGIFRFPAWGYAGVLLSLTAGALSLGAVTMGMVLGHWYLITPRLPEQPLNETTLALLIVLIVQTVLVLIALFIPVQQVPASGASAGFALAQNPAVWLRVGVGLLFPIALALMAWRSSIVRGMMSATGLLYVATGAVLAGEALARGLQLSTGIPF